MSANPIEVPAFVLDTWITRLADAGNGFNPSVAAILQDDGYAIDFTADSTSFIRGSVASVDVLLKSSVITLPLMTLDITRGTDIRSGQYLKFQKFAGTLFGTCQIFISWPEMEAVPDFSRIPHATVAAMYQTMNSTALQQPVVWPNGILYSGEMDFQISPAQFGAQGWIRVVTLNCTFRYATEN